MLTKSNKTLPVDCPWQPIVLSVCCVIVIIFLNFICSDGLESNQYVTAYETVELPILYPANFIMQIYNKILTYANL